MTETGRQRAESVLERHTILSDWLISIGVTKETALEDACRVEHDLSKESFEAIKKTFTKTNRGVTE
ncbi:MAG: iron dependent repressor, metal binding and dimerization domain protein [Acetatifactor sp.]